MDAFLARVGTKPLMRLTLAGRPLEAWGERHETFGFAPR
jgi:hypothetical protein